MRASFPCLKARHTTAVVAVVVALAGGSLISRRIATPRPELVSPPSEHPLFYHAGPTSANVSDPTHSPAPTFSAAMSAAQAGDYPDALRLASTLPEDQRGPAVSSIFGCWAVEDHVAALSAALTLPDATSRDFAWPPAARHWALSDPASLAAYASGLPAGAHRVAALETAISAWIERDSLAAIAWIGDLRAAPENDPAIALVARHPSIIASDPELAVAWAESVSDPAFRSRILVAVVQAWSERDPVAAGSYARASPELSPSQREDILVGERFAEHP